MKQPDQRERDAVKHPAGRRARGHRVHERPVRQPAVIPVQFEGLRARRIGEHDIEQPQAKHDPKLPQRARCQRGDRQPPADGVRPERPHPGDRPDEPKVSLEPACHRGNGPARHPSGMSDECAQPSKQDQEYPQAIDETDRASASDGNQAVAPGSSGRLGREGCTAAGRCNGCRRRPHARRSRGGELSREPGRSATWLARPPAPRQAATRPRGAGARWRPQTVATGRVPTPPEDRTGCGPQAARRGRAGPA